MCEKKKSIGIIDRIEGAGMSLYYSYGMPMKTVYLGQAELNELIDYVESTTFSKDITVDVVKGITVIPVTRESYFGAG